MKLHLTTILILIFVGASFGQSQAELSKAIDLYQQGDYNAAIPILNSVVEADKRDWNAWFYLGMSLAKTDKAKEALDAFRKGNSFYPKDQHLDKKVFRFISKPRPPYTDLARSNNVRGKVLLAVEFRADGRIGTVFPVKVLPDGLTENTIEAAKGIKFEPMMIDNKPMTIIRIMEYGFILRDQ